MLSIASRQWVQIANEVPYGALRAWSSRGPNWYLDSSRFQMKNNWWRTARQLAGTWLVDVPRVLYAVNQPTRPGELAPWLAICNRNEQLIQSPNGVACNWRWSSELFACQVLPYLGKKLLNRAFQDWPIKFANEIPATDSPRVSVIIPHRGVERRPLLLETLRSFGAQIGVPLECIVVEQSIVPSSLDLPANARYVHVPMSDEQTPFNKCRCFNIGSSRARGEILVCHDGDIVVPERYVAEVIRRFQDSELQALFPQRFLFYLTRSSTEGVLKNHRLNPDTCPLPVKQNWRGGTLAIRRRAYHEIGGFHEGFIGWSGEDLEFFERCQTLNCDCHGYIPFVHLWHEPQASKSGPERDVHMHFTRTVMATPPDERVRHLIASNRKAIES